jgi:diaminopimelate epimerase
MKPIDFYKMSGSGNDFIIVDNRSKIVDEVDLTDFIVRVCRRKMSVGADGFILIEPSLAVDFKWRFFNSDGSTAEMCGNGARCAARFAYVRGIAGTEPSFETTAGIIRAQIKGERVKVNMPDPINLRLDDELEMENGFMAVSSVNTGVPHVVVIGEQIEGIDVVALGRKIRYHPLFAPAGTNVNFICRQDEGDIAIRTYERGVEDETLACGTGSIAGAIVAAGKLKLKSPIQVRTRSGEYLTIYFKESSGRFYDIYMEGDARIIYTGKLWQDAWK